MPTRRVPTRRDRRAKLTPKVLELWRLLREIEAAGAAEEFEPEGRKREYLNAKGELDRLLGIRPWEESPSGTPQADPPEWMASDEVQAERWRKAWELRQMLEAAA